MNILIIHQGALGDFIVSLPAIRSVRETHPDSSIEIWGYPHILTLVEKRYYADRIASIHQEGLALLYSHRLTAPPALTERLRHFDLIVLFGGEAHNIFLANLHRQGITCTCRISSFPQEGGNTHVIDHQLEQISRLGMHRACAVPVLFPSEEDCSRAAAFFRDRHIDPAAFTVALHIGSGGLKKVWPPAHFAALTDTLVTRRGARVLVLVGPADEEGEREYRHHVSSLGISVLSNLPLRELAAILKRCTVYAGNDSGITHLAAAAGTPFVAIFGPTNPKVWGPRGKQIITLRGRAECAPCSREEMQSCGAQKCLEGITVEEVYNAIAEIH